jgi:hypothetical protein
VAAAVILAPLGLDVCIDRVCDRLIGTARLVLVDQRRALAVIAVA